MSLQLACFIERITRNFGEKRLTGVVFLDVAKAFNTIWIEVGFEASFLTATSSCHVMQAGVRRVV
jgi:hypothetical protein